MPESNLYNQMTQPQRKAKTLLLDFEGSDSDSDEESGHVSHSNETSKQTDSLKNDFQLLLDLDEQVPDAPETSASNPFFSYSSEPNKQSESGDLFDTDFFSNAPTSRDR